MFTCREAIQKDPLDLWKMRPTVSTCITLINKYEINEKVAAICAGVLLNRSQESYDYITGKSREIVLNIYDSELEERDRLLQMLAQPNENVQRVIPMFVTSMKYRDLTRVDIAKMLSLLHIIGNIGYVERLFDEFLDCVKEEYRIVQNNSAMKKVYRALFSCCPTLTEVIKPDYLAPTYSGVWSVCFEGANYDQRMECYIDLVHDLCNEISVNPHSAMFSLLSRGGV